MDIKTKDLIKILPFGESFRKDLLAKFDTLPLGKKYEVIDLLWRSFEVWYNLKLEENLQLALLAAKEGTEPLDQDFYKRAKERTDEQIQKGAIESVESADLAKAREAMEFIVKEIRASKGKVAGLV